MNKKKLLFGIIPLAVAAPMIASIMSKKWQKSGVSICSAKFLAFA
nr:hypothetical protein [Mycoplasmopsis bovis]